MTKVYEAIDRLSRVSGSLQEYEDLYIMLRNLSRSGLEDAVSKHNLLDIFGHIDLSNSLKYSRGGFFDISPDRVCSFSRNRVTDVDNLVDGVENSSPEDIDIPMKIILEISKIATTEEITTASSARAFLIAFGINHPEGAKTLLKDASLRSHFDSLTGDEEVIRLSEAERFYNQAGLCLGYLSFFATLAEEEPIDFLANPIYTQRLVNCLASYLINSDPVITVCVIETIAQICRTIDGKRVLAAYLEPGACLNPLFLKTASAMLNASADTLPRILLALADVFILPNADDVSTLLPISELTHEWFNLISASSSPTRLLNRIWEIARQPFKEVRSAALNLLRAIASEPWGLVLFVQVPGFLEYLFNPTTEVGTAVDGSSLQPEKFKIIEQCDLTQERWKSEVTQWTLLDDETAVKLKRRVKDGVWGQTRAQAAVAMENE
ncbi:26S proteasome non-ATPase regulatory subunit 5 [Taenia crassiceps]|uniref:26S proteasome non-ATPase regulatory subunit 5 n=1 Tax=Taenia crassiceps TaxID=6207 RepID=A0ABR4QG32_9CEST